MSLLFIAIAQLATLTIVHAGDLDRNQVEARDLGEDLADLLKAPRDDNLFEVLWAVDRLLYDEQTRRMLGPGSASIDDLVSASRVDLTNLIEAGLRGDTSDQVLAAMTLAETTSCTDSTVAVLFVAHLLSADQTVRKSALNLLWPEPRHSALFAPPASDHEVQRGLQLLSCQSMEEATSTLARWSTDQSPKVRCAALIGLATVANEPPATAILAGCSDKSPTVRRRSLAYIFECTDLQGDLARDLLVAGLGDRATVPTVVDELAKHATPDSVLLDAIKSAVENREPFERVDSGQVLRATRRLGDDRAELRTNMERHVASRPALINSSVLRLLCDVAFESPAIADSVLHQPRGKFLGGIWAALAYARSGGDPDVAAKWLATSITRRLESETRPLSRGDAMAVRHYGPMLSSEIRQSLEALVSAGGRNAIGATRCLGWILADST